MLGLTTVVNIRISNKGAPGLESRTRGRGGSLAIGWDFFFLEPSRMGSQNIGVSMLKPSIGVEVICAHRKSETMIKNLIYSNLLLILTDLAKGSWSVTVLFLTFLEHGVSTTGMYSPQMHKPSPNPTKLGYCAACKVSGRGRGGKCMRR